GVDRLRAVNLRLLDARQARVGVSFDEQLDMMIALRQEGLIETIGPSNVSLDQLRHALARTEIGCVQNPLSVVDRGSAPLLSACTDRGIAFVPFFPLGSAFHAVNPVATKRAR